MKTKHYLSVAAVALALAACDDYDDTALWNQVNDNTSRIEALEQWQDEVNNNIAALQQLLNTNDMITSVTPVTLGGEVTGYTIAFLHSDPITIYHGEKGDKGDKGDQGEQGEQGIQGEPGKDGADGADGSDGKDGYTPQIGLTQQTDGNWYWTLDGELMLDPNGDPIRANGDKGEQGEDGDKGDTGATGQPGTPAPTPQIKLGNTITSGTIETDNGTNDPDAWYLSVDNGKTWYRISGDKGDPGATGGQGQQGEQGDSFFTKAPEVDKAAGTVTFYLKGGESFTLPLYQGISISFTDIDDLNQPIGIGEDGTKEIPYTVNGITNAKVTALPTADGWSATVSGTAITVTVTGSNTKCDLLVTATDNAGNSVSYTLHFFYGYEYNAETNTYTVSTAEGLQAWATKAKEDLKASCILMDDIDYNNKEWTAIGGLYNKYAGTFDGGGHTIRNIKINGDASNNGLFGYLAASSAVKNLTVENVKMTTVARTNNNAIIAGQNDGTIENCVISSCTIDGNSFVVGGITCFNKGRISCCRIDDAQMSGKDFGGIVKINVGRIEASSFQGFIDADDNGAGAVVFQNGIGGTIVACWTDATRPDGKTLAGIARYLDRGSVTACFYGGNTDGGILEDNTGNGDATKVDGDWTDAVSKMNAALTDDYGWEWTIEAPNALPTLKKKETN